MKGLFWASILLLILSSSCKKNEGCIDESKIIDGGICYSLYAPVCGCDNVTYGNDCEASNAGVISWTNGKCN